MSEASRLYKVSRRTIERLVKQGALPYHRIGRQIRLLPAGLREVTSHPTSEGPSSSSRNSAPPPLPIPESSVLLPPREAVRG